MCKCNGVKNESRSRQSNILFFFLPFFTPHIPPQITTTLHQARRHARRRDSRTTSNSARPRPFARLAQTTAPADPRGPNWDTRLASGWLGVWRHVHSSSRLAPPSPLLPPAWGVLPLPDPLASTGRSPHWGSISTLAAVVVGVCCLCNGTNVLIFWFLVWLAGVPWNEYMIINE